MSIVLHKKTFQELTTDELYELLRVRSEVFVVEQNCVYQDLDGSPQSETEAMASRLCFMPSTQRKNASMPHA